MSEQSQEIDVAGLPKYFPLVPLKASLGKPASASSMAEKAGVDGLMIKEVRFWNEMLTLDSLTGNRYHQIDPTSAENRALLVYFRMGTGNSHV